MNISTLAKILGISVNDLREVGTKSKIYGFSGRNTRIPYNSAIEITKIVRPDKVEKLKNDDKIYLSRQLTVSEFAETIGKPAGIVVKTLLMSGVMATLNEKIDFDTASLVASELGVEVFPAEGELFENDGISAALSAGNDDTFSVLEDEKSVVRPPVVTVMGHVDHGKTTLLDTIRKTNVVAKEAGAITQHISSYQISYQPSDSSLLDGLNSDKKGAKITFIDTPGHEAFTAMRARGTQLADIIILMVSATEGPKPQTVEVIERAKMSKTQIIVAINKIDLPNSDIEKTKTDIAAFGVVPEEWGGDVPFIPISAKNGTNIEKILDTILLLAQLNEYKGVLSPENGQGVVVESVMDAKSGTQVTMLVTKNSFKVSDYVVCGEMIGKIKKITDSDGNNKQSGVLSEPIEFYGLPDVARIGDMVIAHDSLKSAQNAVNIEKLKKQNKKSIIFHSDPNQDTINLVIKADVSGSLEALKESLLKIPQEQTKIVIKSESVGQVNENDVNFAKTSDSTILAFHTDISTMAATILKSQKVNLIQSNIIYEILEWVEEQILKRVKHEIKVNVLGRAEILGVFKSEKSNIQVFGGEVKEGKILSSKPIRIIRNGEEICKMEILELQKNKTKVSEANISQQFGMSASGKTKILKGDIMECIDEIVVK